MQNVFYLPEDSRWSTIVKQAKQDDIAVRIDTALHAVEKNNPSLKGALPDNYFSRMGIDGAKLAALIDSINNIDTVADEEGESEQDTEDESFRRASDLASQMRRVATSIPAQIAEGRNRGTRQDFQRLILKTRGSLAELATLCDVARRLRLLGSAPITDAYFGEIDLLLIRLYRQVESND